MANVATMGPPPSPKEPRRSGRRSVPAASSSKSPTGSPTTENAPKPQGSTQRPPLPSSSSSSRSKRTKNEEVDETLDDVHRNGVNGTTNGRTKRKGKEKEKGSLSIDIPGDEDRPKAGSSTTGADAQEEEEEETGVTRCICQELGIDESETSEFMAECDGCHAWQHGSCMGFESPETMPQLYYCEKCKPDLYPDLLRRHGKRARGNSIASHVNNARSSRSHSPTYLIKQPPKRRNTMNSRDAMYEQEMRAIIEATAAEAAAAEAGRDPDGREPFVTSPAALNGLDTKPIDTIPEPEPEIVSARRKRKRTEDDSTSTKRARSASIVSDRTHVTNPHPEASPVTTTKPPLPPPSTGGTSNSSTTKPAAPRQKRGGARKAQVQETMSVDGDDATTTSRRQGKKAAEHGTRRALANGLNGHAQPVHQSNAAASRAYHNSHAYAVSQQPLFTSWNLPDYLAHLEPMLPTDVPRPLEVRGFPSANNAHAHPHSHAPDAADRTTTERGVKVKWPGKRMSVVDMNKRVRALVEWVGREQANAAERSRRREAVETALKEAAQGRPRHEALGSVEPIERKDSNATSPDAEASPLPHAPAPLDAPSDAAFASAGVDGRATVSVVLDGLGPGSGLETMKQMEELMEELINFQERFGPGAKVKERERRTAAAAAAAS
ncbi:hypothetical protein PsYK624_088810 [Phanerochaete sordida]|uniref:Zinc finger PHD-type domain-containing protein n=1 Tax=Phanerochaete sordida TaxID=48140 RepID=A0A9P3LEX8_9APHY|nr:hypothetical protein PsYK624_088810 [Phanerochaete sordida]